MSLLSLGGISMLFLRVVDPALCIVLLIGSGMSLMRAAKRAAWQSAAALAATVMLGLLLAVGVCPSRVGDISIHVFPGRITQYGASIEALLATLGLLVPPSDDVIAGINVVAGAGTLVAVFAMTRLLGARPRVAHTAALLFAVIPANLRFIFTFERYPLFLFTMFSGFSLLLAFLSERRRRDLIAAVAAFTLAVQCRPEGFMATLLGGALLFACADRIAALDRASKRALFLAIGTHLALIAAPLAVMVASDMGQVGATYLWPSQGANASVRFRIWEPDRNVFLNRAYTPLAWPLFAAVGLVFDPCVNWRLRAWVLLSAAALTALLANYPVSGAFVGTDYQLSNARYFLASLPFYCFLSASGLHGVVEFLVRRLRATAWNLSESAAHLVAPMALASLAALPARGVLRDTTADQEYRFLQRSLRSVPEGCTLVTIDPWNDRGLRPPILLGEAVRRNQKWRLEQDAPNSGAQSGEEQCAALYLPANCYVGPPVDDAHPWSPEKICAEFAARAGPAIAQAEIANAPFRGEKYRGETLKIGVYWMKRPD